MAYFIGLNLVLLRKAHIEERLMAAKHPDYADYAHTTKRLIPWLL